MRIFQKKKSMNTGFRENTTYLLTHSRSQKKEREREKKKINEHIKILWIIIDNCKMEKVKIKKKQS